jgi:aldose 1-epimerase
MSDDIVLQRGDYALALRPQVGGSVARFTWRGKDVFRPSADGATAPTDMAMFPIAPYVNRIAHGRFEAGGDPVRLDLNFGAHPHALHGHAWQSPWAVTAREGARAHLRFAYAPSDWPWPYVCRQDILVTEQGAEFTLSLENLSDEPMPAGVGFHPYFPHRTETIVCANV